MSNKKVVLVDFSQAAISACAAEAKNIDNDVGGKRYIKHLILGMLLSWKKKFNGKIIIACDAKGTYWRNKEYPHYKGHRTHDNTEYLNFDMAYEVIDEMKEELKENFPYAVLEVKGAEADDVISILCDYYQDNELVQTGLMEEPVDVVIISTDGDFKQLQKYKNVSQWNNVQKKNIVCENPKEFLMEHIVRGDTGDNIPSIVTSDEWSKLRAEGKPTRAPPFATKRLQDFFNEGIEACKDKDERTNFKRNDKLVNLSNIPEHINKSVIDEYTGYVIKGNKTRVFNYLVKNNMKLLLSSANEF